jgi:hypothetical protein
MDSRQQRRARERAANKTAAKKLPQVPRDIIEAGQELVKLRIEGGAAAASSMLDAIDRIGERHGSYGVGFLSYWFANETTRFLRVLTDYQAEATGELASIEDAYDIWTQMHRHD